MTGNDFDLILRHFRGWATKKGRSPDYQLLDELLHLRATYDELLPTFWPAGSVEHLLTERWPAKGPTVVPDQTVVVETLDGYVRFLRSTGRMAARSAEPAVLTKEARRHAKQMAESAGDRSTWSIGKVLTEFGRDQGIDLDGAEDTESLRARMQQVQDAWNSLPIEERQRLSPGLGAPAEPSRLSGKEQALAAYDIDDPLVALLLTFSDRLPTGKLPDDEVVATCFRDSTYATRMLALAEWVGEGKEVTSIGVLRPALARELYDVLGLGDWQLEQLRRRYPDERWPGVARMGLEVWIAKEMEQKWRSAADCEELHRLWIGAIGCGLVELGATRARFSGERGFSSTRWVELGVHAAVTLANGLEDRRQFLFLPLVWALMESYVGGGRPVDKAEVQDFIIDWNYSADEQERWREWADADWEKRHHSTSVEEAVGLLADTGLYVEDGATIRLTPFGDVLVTAWLRYLERPEGQ